MDESSFLTRLHFALKEFLPEDMAQIRQEVSVNISGMRRIIDLVIQHSDWGLFVILVKSYTVEDIKRASSQFELERLGVEVPRIYENPKEQAINLLWAMYYQLRSQQRLSGPVRGHVLIAYPNITRDEWNAAGFKRTAEHLTDTILADDLTISNLQYKLKNASITSVETAEDQYLSKRKKKHDIFISYRREDSEWAAGRVADSLMREFGEDRVFLDTSSIRPGKDFPKVIKDRIKATNIMLVIIGKRWLIASHDESGIRRLDDEEDYVRWEIALALDENLEIIPVLIDGVQMPRRNFLPTLLERLVDKNAYDLNAKRYRRDMKSLIEELAVIMAQIETGK